MPVTDQTPEVMLFDTNGVEVPVANGVAIPLGTRGIIGAGSDGANARFVSVDTSGRQLAVGPSAVGAAVAGAPVLAGGSDGANARYLLVDANGRQIAVGAAAAGAAPAGNPVLVSGSDGAAVRALLTDVGGRQIAVGAAAAAAAPVGNPVLVGGSDGAVVRTRLLDTSGRGIAVGAAAAGAAIAGNPVLTGGSDGANARALLTDASGRQRVIGAAANGAAVAGDPVLTGGSDGTNARTLRTDAAGNLYVITLQDERASWSAVATGITVDNNKSMISILNATGTAVVIRIREIWVENTAVSPVNGVNGRFEVHRMTGHSGGTLITPLAYDTADTLDGNVTVRTGATIAGEVAGVLWQKIWNTDNKQGPAGGIGQGNSNSTITDHTQQALMPFWSRKDLLERPFTLRSGQGITIKFATNSTNGTFDLTLVFTQAST